MQRVFIEWLRYILQRIGISEDIPEIHDLKEFHAMLEERLRKWKENQEASWRREWSEEWKEQYLSEGRKEPSRY